MYVNDNLKELLFDELRQYTNRKDNQGGFIPAVKQLANVASLPGVVDVFLFSYPYNIACLCCSWYT